MLHDDHAVEAHPDLSIAASWLYALRGQAEDAQHWADAATRGLDGGDPRLRVLQALRCRDGADQMLDDTTRACRALPAGHAWQPAAKLAHGVALMLANDPERAAPNLVEARIDSGEVVLGQFRVPLAADRSPGREAGRVILGIRPETFEDAAFASPDLHVEVVGGGWLRARSATRQPGWRPPSSCWDMPRTRCLAGDDRSPARTRAARARRRRRSPRPPAQGRGIFRVRRGSACSCSRAPASAHRALAEPEGRWASSLTPAEHRLLPLLATHLSFREIGERLYVSRNTVKTQAIAVYRKFGVTSRSEAIARAIALGLIDDNALVAHGPLQCAD